MKKITALALVLAMVFTFASCGNKVEKASNDETKTDSTESVEESAPVAKGDTKGTKLTVCGTNGNGDTQSIAHQELADRLNALGGWNVDAMVNSELGSTDDVMEQAINGAPLISSTDPSRLAAYVPEFGILMMPYLLDDYSQLDNLMDTELYKGWCEKLDEKGITLLTNNCLTGWRNWVTNKVIEKPEDLHGLKIRTMGNPIAINSVNACGAIATPMAQSEAYNGIETKVIDGGEWQIPTIYSAKFYEVCKNVSLSHHFLLTGSIACGSAWYDTLSEEQQTQLTQTAVETYKDNQALVLEYEEKFLKEMQDDYDVTVTEPDRAAFKEATSYLYSDEDTTGGVDYESLRTELYKQLGIEQ